MSQTPSPNQRSASPGQGGADKGARLNTLGLDARGAEALLERMDRAPTPANARRTHLRWPFRHASVPLEVIHAGGLRVRFNVICRNISCGGLGVLHSAFVHPGSRCAITLPHPSRGTETLEGVVSRCRHHTGMIHELGIRFDELVDVRDFVKPDRMSECFSLERVDPEKLQGCVVVVEDSQMDQTIIKHFLRRTMLRVRPALNIEGAKKICKEPCDLILCDFHLPDGDACAFLSWLRAEGVHAPVIAVTCDASGPTRDRLRSAECDAFLAKPLTEDKLLRAIGEFLIMDRGGAGGSSLSRDDPKAALIFEFVKEIETYRQKIADAVKQADAMTCYIICQQLKGTAPCLGFDTLAKVAERAGEQVAATMSTEESSRALQELLNACERALRNR